MKNYIILILTLFTTFFLQAGDHIYVKSEYYIEVENGKVYLIQIGRNYDGISINLYRKIELPIENKNPRVIAYGGGFNAYVMVANDDYCYYKNAFIYIDKDNTYDFHKVFPTKSLTATFGEQTYCIDGIWYWIDFIFGREELLKKELKGFPNHPEIIYKFKDRESYLLKDDKAVYSYNEITSILKVISNLDPKTVHFQPALSEYDAHSLYDEDTFYLTDLDFEVIGDLTEKNTPLGVEKVDFTKGVFAFDINDRTLTYFYPYQNITFRSDLNLAMRNNQYFCNFKDVYKEYKNGMSIAKVKNINKLKYLRDYNLYYDENDFYIIDYYRNEFTPIALNESVEEILKSKKYENNINKYYWDSFVLWNNKIVYLNQSYNTIKFLEPNKISNLRIKKELPLTSELKDLKICFATKDYLWLENKLIKNICDFNTMEFVGTIFINDYLGHDYYFKDKNGVYLYHTKGKKMKKLSYNPKTFTEMKMAELKLKS